MCIRDSTYTGCVKDVAAVAGGTAAHKDYVTGKNFFAMIDTERMCGHADLTGLSTKGGVPINVFFRGLFKDALPKQDDGTAFAAPDSVDGVAVSSKHHAVVEAYVHVQYVKMVSLSSAGVMVEE